MAHHHMRVLGRRSARVQRETRRRRLADHVARMLVLHSAFLLDPVAEVNNFAERRGTKARAKAWAQTLRRSRKNLRGVLPPEERAPQEGHTDQVALTEAFPPGQASQRHSRDPLDRGLHGDAVLRALSLPRLLTLRDLCGILGMRRQATARLVAREIEPLGGLVRVGTGQHAKWLIHPWALAVFLRLPDPRRCPVCRRAWDTPERKHDGGTRRTSQRGDER